MQKEKHQMITVVFSVLGIGLALGCLSGVGYLFLPVQLGIFKDILVMGIMVGLLFLFVGLILKVIYLVYKFEGESRLRQWLLEFTGLHRYSAQFFKSKKKVKAHHKASTP